MKIFAASLKDSTVLFCVIISVNIAGFAGLRKNGSFLPVPDTWRQKMRLRDKYQYCLLLPWLLVYGLITIVWAILFIPLSVVLGTL